MIITCLMKVTHFSNEPIFKKMFRRNPNARSWANEMMENEV